MMVVVATAFATMTTVADYANWRAFSEAIVGVGNSVTVNRVQQECLMELMQIMSLCASFCCCFHEQNSWGCASLWRLAIDSTLVRPTMLLHDSDLDLATRMIARTNSSR